MRWWVLLALTARAVAAPSPYEAFTTDYPPSYAISGFDFLSRLEVFRPFDGERKSFSAGAYSVTWEQPSARIVIAFADRPPLTIPIEPVIAQAERYLSAHPGSARAMPQAALTWEAGNPSLRAKLFFDDISLRRENGALTLYHFKADVLLKSSDTGTKR